MSCDEIMMQDVNNLFKIKLEYINTLRTLQEDIKRIINKGQGSVDQVIVKKKVYDQTWCEFVCAHEQYFEAEAGVQEKERASRRYKELMEKKVHLDEVVESWCKGSKSGNFKNKIRSLNSGSIGATSSSSTVSRKREKVALAQLKVNQLMKRHEMKRRMEELRCQEELREAQMEEEQAIVSYNIYNDQAYVDSKSYNGHKSFVDNREVLQKRSSIGYQPQNYGSEEYPMKSILCNASNEQERLQSRFEEDQRGNYRMVARPVVGVADNISWEDAILTTVKQPMIGYPKLVQPVKEKTSLYDLSSFMPQASEYPRNQRSPPSRVHGPYVERNRNGGDLNAEASTWHPITGLLEESIRPPRQLPEAEVGPPITMISNSGEEMIRALRQVVSTPRIKCMHFDGDPMNYVSFIHNFETCLEKDNPDSATRLQLLIQHCSGKAKEAIESCVNLPVGRGYITAKNTLKENFGKPHIIAKAHIKQLESLPPLKQADGPSLLEYARNLEIAH